MLLEYRLPAINANMTEATIAYRYAGPGDALGIGSKLFDLRVDLSSAFSQDCPPISYYRIVMRERAFLRDVFRADREAVAVGELVALFSTESDEPTDAAASRTIRVATAGISHPGGVGAISS